MRDAALVYLNNRHYDPTTGVFTSVDPLAPMTMQPYLYGAARPSTISDPSGLCGCEFFGIPYDTSAGDPQPFSDEVRQRTVTNTVISHFNPRAFVDRGGCPPVCSPSELLDVGITVAAIFPYAGDAIDAYDCAGGSRWACGALAAPIIAKRWIDSLLGARGIDFPGGSLRTHEGRNGGHTIERHVGKSDTYLALRLAEKDYLDVVGTFFDLPTAERAISATLDVNRADIADWLATNPTSGRTFVAAFDNPSGVSLRPEWGAARPASSVEVRLVPDSSMPGGYSINSAWPFVPAS